MYMGKRSKLLCLYDGPNVNNPVKTGSLIVWQAMTIWLTVLLVSILFLSINLSCESHQLRAYTLMGRLPFGFVDVFVSCYTETI